MILRSVSVAILSVCCFGAVGHVFSEDNATFVGGSGTNYNLLFITADDMNADSSGWMGSKMGATPILDALAAASHRFVNNHVTVPICQPSRAVMMTGRVPHRNGALGFNPVTPGTPTLVTVLKSAGYYTAGINKTSHMKPTAEFPWDDDLGGSGKNPQLLREQFETTLKNAAAVNKPFFVNVNIQYPHRPFPGSADIAVAAVDGFVPKNKSKLNKKKAAKVVGKKNEGIEVNEKTRVFESEEIAVPEFLEDIPLVRAEVAQYFTAVARVDTCLQGVLDALHASGHADNTIILFLSDHGMSFPFSKASVYVNGTHSPIILKFPGMPTPASHQEFVSSVDIMPTLLDLLAIKHPDGMDGRSWGPLLRGENQEERDFVVTYVNTVSSGKSFPQRCIRTKDWALMFHAWPDGSEKFKVEAMNGQSYKALESAAATDKLIAGRVKQFTVGEPLMFFNELIDPSERTNSINDPNYVTEIRHLATKLLAEMEKTYDPQVLSFKRAFEDWNANAK